MRKLGIGLLKGLVKPLPLSKIIDEIKEVRASKWEAEKVVKIGAYVVAGVVIYGIIFKGLAPETAKMIFDFLASII